MLLGGRVERRYERNGGREMGQRIDINHLNVYYGDFLAVQDVNMRIQANKVTAFIGPSGCGKSTVLRTLDRACERAGALGGS